jgi:hypothetical protein
LTLPTSTSMTNGCLAAASVAAIIDKMTERRRAGGRKEPPETIISVANRNVNRSLPAIFRHAR